MDVEAVARKLEPLMPEKVRHWLRVRDTTTDADLRKRIESQIFRTAHRVLGDFRRKILLSLPPPEKARGSIDLGTLLYDGKKWAFGIHEKELLQNVVIFGRSGSGKTNTLFYILEQLVGKNIPWLFLDWKRTARHLLPRLTRKVNLYTPGRVLAPFAFNPFIVPPGEESSVYLGRIVDVMASAFTLGEGAKSVLQRAIPCW